MLSWEVEETAFLSKAMAPTAVQSGANSKLLSNEHDAKVPPLLVLSYLALAKVL